jgi:putative ABC transport system substrate-binding protein
MSSPETGTHLLDAFRQELRKLGYVEGQTLTLEVRWGEGRAERVTEMVGELVHLNVDVLVVTNILGSVAARNATRTIPTVAFAGAPVELGLAASFARPGGNITGLSFFSVDLMGKRLQLLTELVPGASRVAIFRNRTLPREDVLWQVSETAASKMGVALQSIEMQRPEDFEPAFAAAARARAQAIYIPDEPLTFAYRPRLVTLAADNRLPAMYGTREYAVDGGLMSYGPNFVALMRRAANFVDKILKGTNPGDIPFEQPTTFNLVINLRTAKALDLAVPQILLAQADEVIE